jgi:hypothetical protein
MSDEYEEKTTEVDAKLNLVRSDGMGDWFTIERAEHANQHWMKPIGNNSMAMMYSGRISDACVEGTAEEMLEIGKAIEDRRYVSFKRCSVDARGERALFNSPRNSLVTASVPMEFAGELAQQIKKELG